MKWEMYEVAIPLPYNSDNPHALVASINKKKHREIPQQLGQKEYKDTKSRKCQDLEETQGGQGSYI